MTDEDYATQEPDVVERVLEGLNVGLSIRYAAEYAGISHVTVFNWLKDGEAYEENKKVGNVPNENHAPHAQFLIRCRQTIAQRNAAGLARIRQKGERDWKSDAYLVSHWMQEDYGDKAQVQLSGPQGGPIQIQQQPVDPKTVRDLLEAMREIKEANQRTEVIEDAELLEG